MGWCRASGKVELNGRLLLRHHSSTGGNRVTSSAAASPLTDLHTARRAHSPLVNLVGEHPRSHVQADPPSPRILFRSFAGSGMDLPARSASATAADYRRARLRRPKNFPDGSRP